MIYLNVWALLLGTGIGSTAILEIIYDVKVLHLLPLILLCESMACFLFWIDSLQKEKQGFVYKYKHIFLPLGLSIGWYFGSYIIGGRWDLDTSLIATLSFYWTSLVILQFKKTYLR